jgi:hypothetical protein
VTDDVTTIDEVIRNVYLRDPEDGRSGRGRARPAACR